MAATGTAGNMQQLMMDTAVDMALEMTAKVFGIPKEAVTRIVQAGLPAMAAVAQTDPDLFSAIYAQSVKMLPEPMLAFYAKLAESPEAQARLSEEFNASYGPMVEAINREAASQAGATETQAGQVLAATMPAMIRAMARETEGTGEAGMMAWLKAVGKTKSIVGRTRTDRTPPNRNREGRDG